MMTGRSKVVLNGQPLKNVSRIEVEWDASRFFPLARIIALSISDDEEINYEYINARVLNIEVIKPSMRDEKVKKKSNGEYVTTIICERFEEKGDEDGDD